jgi:hypothetical protein
MHDFNPNLLLQGGPIDAALGDERVQQGREVRIPDRKPVPQRVVRVGGEDRWGEQRSYVEDIRLHHAPETLGGGTGLQLAEQPNDSSARVGVDRQHVDQVREVVRVFRPLSKEPFRYRAPVQSVGD